MKFILVIFISIFVCIPTIIFAASPQYLNPIDYVNPFIGSNVAPRYFFFSSASRPFGLVNLSPDTSPTGWQSGYIYKNTTISCLSHIHCWQVSALPVMPTTGTFNGNKGMTTYRSSFSHTGEIAKPGYHKVFLSTYGITAELTSSERAGFHKYTFPFGNSSSIIFDTGANMEEATITSSEVKMLSDTILSGFQIVGATVRRPKEYKVFFYAKVNKKIEKFIGWKSGTIDATVTNQISGSGIGAAIQFNTIKDEVVMMKVGISYVSEDQAKLNLETEITDWNFDRIKEESFAQWNSMLGRIKVEGGTQNQKIKFYTDLWHSILGRRMVNDVNGKYTDMTGSLPQVRQLKLDDAGKPLLNQYNFDALWGSHWSLNILWSLVYPEIMDGFCNTMVEMYKNGGIIPRGPSAGNYTFVMIGDPATPFFAAAYNKGIRGYDIETAYEGLRKNAFEGGIRDHAGYQHESTAKGGGMAGYVQKGYVAEDRANKGGYHAGSSAAMTLEYAYQDWALGQLAKTLGKNDDYEFFNARSQNYKNVYNPKTGYMQKRKMDGSFYPTFSPMETGGFTECSSAVYTFFVPHDIKGLSTLMGGDSITAARLNTQFEKGEILGFKHNSSVNDGYWITYANQPGTGMAHIFNYLGKPWLTQKWVRAVKKVGENVTADGGYLGDEDQGQMGALGALMSIGLFDFTGGAGINPSYDITSPIFDKITISLNKKYYKGDSFIIETVNNSESNMYINQMKLNNAAWSSFKIPHETITNGGTLKLYMGNVAIMTPIDKVLNTSFTAFATNGVIRVKNLQSGMKLSIYDIDGRTLASKVMDGSTEYNYAPSHSGVFIVKVFGNSFESTQKVIVL